MYITSVDRGTGINQPCSAGESERVHHLDPKV
jgi:hypothetical protein